MPSDQILIDSDLTLFDAEQYWQPLPEQVPEVVPSDPEPVAVPPVWSQLGFDNRERGKATENAFRWEIAALGGTTSLPPDDPAGGVRSDVWIQFPGWECPITVQVRSAVLRKGCAQFQLGPKEGSQVGRDRRRHQRYYGRANLFALAVYEGDGITHWYLIPAKKLRDRVTLKVTPGQRALRRRKDWLEPERYRNQWLRLADEAKSALEGILGR